MWVKCRTYLPYSLGLQTKTCITPPVQWRRCRKREELFSTSTPFQPRAAEMCREVGSFTQWHLTKWLKTTVMNRCSVWSKRFTYTRFRHGHPTVDIGKKNIHETSGTVKSLAECYRTPTSRQHNFFSISDVSAFQIINLPFKFYTTWKLMSPNVRLIHKLTSWLCKAVFSSPASLTSRSSFLDKPCFVFTMNICWRSALCFSVHSYHYLISKL